MLRLIRGTAPNREALWSEVFASVSDCLVMEPTWPGQENELRAALERIDLERGREKAVALRPWPVRGTLRVWLWKRLDELLSATAATA
ncbi:MAG: hypothetical protein INR68_17000 [Methylobacterium mesophilicum]|nr:hypothetical protein [Methylobacterium mesophilicum]